MNNIDLKPVKEIEAFARKQFRDNHFIYYRRKGDYAECHCAECGAKYVLRAIAPEDPFSAAALLDTEKPERDKETFCRKCKIKAIYKPAGHTKSEYSYRYICFGQKLNDENFVFRIFYTTQKTYQGQQTHYGCFEDERIYLEKSKKPSRYYNAGGEWYRRPTGEQWYYIVHPKTYKEIAKCGMFKYVPRDHSILRSYRDECGLIRYYIAAARYPDFEMIIKMGLTEYAYNLVENISVNPNPRGRTIEDRLRINKDRIKDLVAYKGEKETLMLYQMERRVGAHWTKEEISILEELRDSTYTLDWEKVSHVLKFASPIRIKNYMIKQKMWMPEGLNAWQERNRRQDLRREYFDYIRMRLDQGYDLTNDIFLFPADFVRRRDEMILQAERQKMDKRKKEVLEKFPRIKSKYKTLSDKYSATAGDLIIRPAKDAAEIVEEGRILHHCVGGDNYLSSHNNGRSFILFLRDIKAKDVPLITVEIRGETVLQWYGAYDKKPNEKLINAWLKTYTKELKKRKEKGAKNGTHNKQLSRVQASA